MVNYSMFLIENFTCHIYSSLKDLHKLLEVCSNDIYGF